MIEIVDVHCHILPGVDDGPQFLNESKKILLEEYKQGVRRIIFTPHYREHYFETNREILIQQYYKIKKLIRDNKIPMSVHLGCECHCHEMIGEHLKSGFCLTMAKGNYVLIEFSSSDTFMKIRGYIYELKNLGYEPVIAHIERYPCIIEKMDLVQELVSLGARIQINSDSVLGNNGRMVKKFCLKLMKLNLVDFIASDVHNCTTRKTNIGKCVKYVERKMGKNYAKKIFFDNPMKMIKSRRII